jgi:hypothetical protein
MHSIIARRADVEVYRTGRKMLLRTIAKPFRQQASRAHALRYSFPRTVRRCRSTLELRIIKYDLDA